RAPAPAAGSPPARAPEPIREPSHRGPRAPGATMSAGGRAGRTASGIGFRRADAAGARVRSVGLVLAVTFLALVALAALSPGLLAWQDPLLTDVRAALQPPSAAHPFGTDQSGRDVYSRVVHAAARSAGIGALATLLALAAGL